MPIENGDLAIIERRVHKIIDDKELVTEEHCEGKDTNINLKLKVQGDKIEEVESEMSEITKKLDTIPRAISDAMETSQKRATTSMRGTFLMFSGIMGLLIVVLKYA